MMKLHGRSRRIPRRAWSVESLEGRRLMTADLLPQQTTVGPIPSAVRFAYPSINYMESAGVVPITITRDGDLSAAATARVRTSSLDALDGYDYLGLDQDVTFAPGAATATFNLTILDDDVSEPLTKALNLLVTEWGGQTYPYGADTMMVIIQDDEPGDATPLSFHAFGDAGLWTYNDVEGYRKINDASPEAIYAAPNRGAYLDFGAAGLWSWDALRGYEKLNDADPQAILTSSQGDALLIDFGAAGLWSWSRAGGYAKITDVDPKQMAGTVESALVDFGAAGLWAGSPSSWVKLDDQSPEAIVAGNDTFYVDFGARGLWKTTTMTMYALSLDDCVPVYRTALEQINAGDPTTMTSAWFGAVVGFGDSGLWTYDAGAGGWAKINDVAPTSITTGNAGFYMNYGAAGLWLRSFDGVWSKLNDVAPASISPARSFRLEFPWRDSVDLDYGDAGLWRWSYTTGEWSRLRSDRVTALGLARDDTGVSYGIPV